MATTPENGEKRPRRAVPIILIVLATLIGIVSVLAVWVKRQALETETWVDTSGQLLEDETISDAIGDFLVASLFDNVDVAGRDRLQAPAAGRAAGRPARRRPQTARQPRRGRGASERAGAGGLGGRESRGPPEADRPAGGRGRVRLDHRWRGHPRPDGTRDPAVGQPRTPRRTRQQAARRGGLDRDHEVRRAVGGTERPEGVPDDRLDPRRPHVPAVRAGDLPRTWATARNAPSRRLLVRDHRRRGPHRAQRRWQRRHGRPCEYHRLGGAGLRHLGDRDLPAQGHGPVPVRLRHRHRPRGVARGPDPPGDLDPALR